MQPRIHSHDRWWWAWSFTTGWPRRVRRAYLRRNEYDPSVRHLGCVLLGCSLEIRWSLPCS